MLTMICLVVGTVLCFVIGGFCLNDYQHKWADLAAVVSMRIGIVGIIAVIGTTIAIIVVHVNPEGQLAAYQSEKAMLEYRLDQEYLNDNNIGMTELMRDITEYNSNLAEAQHGCQSPWVNWFYADYVNELTPIILDNSD